MVETTTHERYLALQRELRATLSVARKWTAMPGLLDELDRLRREQPWVGACEHDRRQGRTRGRVPGWM